MKKIIFRKPKFLRSDMAMKAYIDVGASISKCMCKPGLTSDEQYELAKRCGECLNKAAKAGGFFSTKDFITWMKLQTN